MNTEQLAVVTKRTIEGASQRAIAAEIGTSHVAVHRAINRPDVRAKIEAGANKIINRGLNPSINTLCRLAAIGNTKYADKDLLKLSLDASKHITSIAGLSGSNQSTIINTLINVNANPEHERELSAIEMFLADKQWQSESIEIESPLQNVNGDSEMVGETPSRAATADSTISMGIVENQGRECQDQTGAVDNLADNVVDNYDI
jgi:hypothetical protein